MNELLFRFTLNNSVLGSLVIAEPIGWKEATLKLERHPEFHSLVELYDQPFTFYGGPTHQYNGGYEYLLSVLSTQGPDADIIVTVEISDDQGVTYELFFEGLIDLESKKDIDSYKVQFAVIRENFWSRFINQRDTSIDVQATEDVYGESRVVLDTIDERLTNQVVQAYFEGFYAEDPSEVIEYDLNDNEYAQIDFPFEIISDIEEKYSLPRVNSPAQTSAIFGLKYGGDYDFDIFINSSTSFLLGATIDPDIKCILSVDGAVPIFLTRTDIPGVDSYTTFTYSGILNIPKGSNIKLYFWKDGTANEPRWYVFSMSYMKVTAYTYFKETSTEAIMIHEAGQSILDRIIGQDDTLYSEYLGNPDTQRNDYEGVGCFSYAAIKKGLHLKTYTFAEKPFTISFNDYWKGLNPILNLGLGYEVINSVKKIRIEKKEYFYDPDPILNLDYVNKIEKSINAESIYKNIKIGYEKWESENVSGLDEIQTRHEYAVALKKIGFPIELYSKFIAASLAIENTRRKVLEKDKDWRLDENVFITHLFKNGSPDYIPYTADNLGSTYPNGSGINYPESRYNLLLTPARNMLRWRNFLNGGVQFNSDYLFQGGEGNLVADVNDNNARPCDYGTVDENGNIPITNDYLFGIDVYEFEHPLSWSEYKLLRENRNKALGVSTTNTGHETVFILSLEWSPVTPKGIFKVVKAV